VQAPLQPEQPTPHLPHDQVPVTETRPDFILATESEKIIAFLQSCSFKQENGHSVTSFGTPYHYMGSKSSENVPPIPEELKPLFDEMNKVQTELFNKSYPDQPHLTAPVINSCLINRYDGSDSHLPNHSDREVTIHPESSILTLSLGQICNIKFTECDSRTESSLECHDRSLYIMSRRSQEVYSHMIERGSISDGIRYSLTFRAVSWTNKNCTSLHGDSNTGFLRFGSDKRGTFGELMPGQKFWAPRIEDINPVSCMGYANVVLHCGINDVRQPDISCENDVADCYNKLKLKIKQIKNLSPSTRAVFVCKLLPTKDLELNVKVNAFNRLIHFDLLPTCKDVVCVKGFEKFACNYGLADELSKQFDRHGRPDTLHLNKLGARVLAGLIKQSVFIRLNGGEDRRKHIGKVNGRLYSNVASDPPALQRRGRNG
jgi:alkylated DNA repair dioxygenase AlkB